MMGIENLANSATAVLLRPGLSKAATPASGAAGAAGAFAELLSASLDESPNIDTGIDIGIDTDTGIGIGIGIGTDTDTGIDIDIGIGSQSWGRVFVRERVG